VVTDSNSRGLGCDNQPGPIASNFEKLLTYYLLRPTQLHNLNGTRNEYQPMGRDVLRWGVKAGMA